MDNVQILELGLLQSTNEKKFIKILPNKKVWLEDYKRWVDFSDPKIQNNLKMAYDSGKIFKPPLDKNHDYQENYAEFGDLEIREDGIYLETTLNEKGVELVKGGIYRYISPVIRDVVDTDGKKWQNVLFAVSLTNIPALLSELPDLKSQLSLSKNTKKEKERMQNLALKLSLNPEASESAMIEAVEKINVELKKKSDEVIKLQALTEADKQALADLQVKFNEIMDKFTKQSEEIAEKEAEEVIGMAVKEGKITPDEKLTAHYKDRYKKDKESVKLELSLMKPVISGQQSVAGSTVSEADKEILEMAKKAGVDPKNKEEFEAFKLTLKGE